MRLFKAEGRNIDVICILIQSKCEYSVTMHDLIEVQQQARPICVVGSRL